ncbi:MAG: DNA-binding domain-containing protein, partial [Pseudomonadota bacterium]
MSKTKGEILNFKVGAPIRYNNSDYVIGGIHNSSYLSLKSQQTGRIEVVSIADISRQISCDFEIRSEQNQNTERDLLSLTEEERLFTEHYRKIITPMLIQPREKGLHLKIAQELQISVPTLYRMINEFKRTGKSTAFLQKTRPGGKGKSRIDPVVEKIIQTYLNEKYLTKQKPSIKAAIDDIQFDCKKAGLKIPSINTIRIRISQIEEATAARRRLGNKAGDRFKASLGSIPDTDWPLALAQMDHTILPVIIVDDVYRLPINRAWVTFIIDVFSRMIL